MKKEEESKQVHGDNSFGVASVVLGILSIVFASLFGIVFGIIAFVFSNKQQRIFKNKWSKWGKILSIIGIISSILAIIINIVYFNEIARQFQLPIQ